MNNAKAVSLKDKDGEKQIESIKKPQDPARREAASAKRMQELMRQFSTILRQASYSLPFICNIWIIRCITKVLVESILSL